MDHGLLVLILFVGGFMLSWMLVCAVWEAFENMLEEDHPIIHDMFDQWLWDNIPCLAKYEYYEDEEEGF